MTFRHILRFMLTSLFVSLSACGGDENAMVPAPARAEPPLPTAPAQNDPAFAVSKVRSWYILGDAVTPSTPFDVEVTSPPDVERRRGDVAARREVH